MIAVYRQEADVSMHPLAKQLAELSLRLTALPADGLRDNTAELEQIEHLATQVLNEVAALRRARHRTPGEASGMWRVMLPVRR